GPDEDNVTHLQLRERNGFGLRAPYALGSVREKRSEGGERATSLGNSPHLQPMAEEHDGDERRELPPDLDFEEANSPRERRAKGDDDCQGDERHHAGLVIDKFAPGSAD